MIFDSSTKFLLIIKLRQLLLAAEHKDNVNPISYYDVNVEGTKNVLKEWIAMELLINFYQLSSCLCLNTKFNEQSNPKPFNHYGKSKLKAEK